LGRFAQQAAHDEGHPSGILFVPVLVRLQVGSKGASDPVNGGQQVLVLFLDQPNARAMKSPLVL